MTFLLPPGIKGLTFFFLVVFPKCIINYIGVTVNLQNNWKSTLGKGILLLKYFVIIAGVFCLFTQVDSFFIFSNYSQYSWLKINRKMESKVFINRIEVVIYFGILECIFTSFIISQVAFLKQSRNKAYIHTK